MALPASRLHLPQQEVSQADLLTVRDLTLSRSSRQVTLREQPVSLTPTEFDILEVLMSRLNTAVDAVALVKAVRGYEANETDARAIARVHIHRLRQKLEAEPSNPKYVQTIAGGRYLIHDDR
jgi:DNA-binding response OmpR family regulator